VDYIHNQCVFFLNEFVWSVAQCLDTVFSISIFFFSIQFVAVLGLVAVLVTSFVARLERNIVWTNYLITWIISALSYLILPVVGQQSGPQPNYGICLTQAVLIYGAPPLTAFSGFSLIVQVSPLSNNQDSGLHLKIL
jgi:hypothetical protein